MIKLRLTLWAAVVLIFLGHSSVALATDCFVDSQNGDDSKNGLTEANAVKTQAKIPISCTVVKYKRGSQFNEAVKISGSARTYTSYGNASDPLPRFEVPRTTDSGSVVSAYQGGITVNGLYLAGSCGNGTMEHLAQGICVMLGGNSKLLNSEIANCDIGIMLVGERSLVQGNYVHDLIMGVDADPGVDPNVVGGAEGIFINASNNEVAYNSFVNCKGPAKWVGGNGSCDGGATEVTVAAGATMTGVKVHHNFSYNSCGFLEIASGFGNSKGTFADSDIYNNVSIDSGWMALLQVNNTNLSNIKFYNNTFVQRKGSTNAGILAVIYTDTSSGMTGGDLLPNTVFLTNNLYVFDEVTTFGNLLDPDFAQTTNLIIDTAKQDPGFINIHGTAAPDFDLTASSPAIDKGTLIATNTLDYLNRTVPNPGGLTDVGAFEYGSTEGTGGNRGTTSAVSGAGGGVSSAGRGGSSAAGGSAAAGVGGSDASRAGGTGGSGVIGGVSGGSAGIISGGTSGSTGSPTDNSGGCACSIGPRHGSASAGMFAGLMVLSLLASRRR